MYFIKRISAIAVTLLLLGWSAVANAVVIYDFAGTATETHRIGGQAVLTLTDAYTPGTALSDEHFVSLAYTAFTTRGSITYEFTDTGSLRFESLTGRLPEVSGNALEAFFLDIQPDDGPVENTHLSTGVDGSWAFLLSHASGHEDRGNASSSTWTLRAIPVPEPATLALFGLGLAGLGFVRRRKGTA